MNEVSKEQLSALMDGELAADETRFLLRRIQHEPDMVAAWGRYHVSRECLRGELRVAAATDGFVLRVMAQAQAPQAGASSRARRWGWLRVGVGGTIAAGVAVVALVAVRPAAYVAPNDRQATIAVMPAAQSQAQVLAAAALEPAAARQAAADTLPPPLLRSRSPLLKVEPASAVRSSAFYARPLTFDRRSPPRWIVQHQSRQSNRPTLMLEPQRSPVAGPEARFGSGY